ncbi:MAG: 3'-5' exonuclease [Anaerolineales bacterium]
MKPDWLVNCVSVDIEAAGPYPARYPMLSIGACLVEDIQNTFYAELKPDRVEFQEHALNISGFSMPQLERFGIDPERAMQAFGEWLSENTPGQPICVAFNAPFDWMFINDYFHRYYGSNPFGHSALDIKALFLGLTGGDWKDTHMDAVNIKLGLGKPLSHHALEDAQDQANLFLQIIERLQNKSSEE